MNNTVKTFRVSAFAAAAALAAFASAPASATHVKSFGGGDANWFNPENWTPYGVPGPDDSVELDGRDYVVIDQAQNRSGGKVQFQDLHVRDAARFEVIGGAIVQTRDQVLHDQGQIIFRASGDAGESLIVAGRSDPDACTDCVLVQNPNPKTQRAIVLQYPGTVDMGLGGTTPASLTKIGAGDVILSGGPGHHSTMTADALVIDGDLKISTYYGFEPQPGDSFQIMTANRTRTGEFIGLPEGGYAACTDRNVCLRISYQGGDGNDVVLTAETVHPAIGLLLPAVQKVSAAAGTVPVTYDLLSNTLPEAGGLLLPAVQKVREAANRATEQTREHILLARQVGVPVVEETESKLPSPTTPISGPKPTRK